LAGEALIGSGKRSANMLSFGTWRSLLSPASEQLSAFRGIRARAECLLVVLTETLPSGLRLVTESMPHVRSVSIGVWLMRGSRHESDAESGIAHFVEHMLFKGTAYARRSRSPRKSIRSAGSSTRSPRRSTPATTSRCSTRICRPRRICSAT
jgi:hypothetical protein